MGQNIISAANRKISQFSFHYFRVYLSEKIVSLFVPQCYTHLSALFIKRKQIKYIS